MSLPIKTPTAAQMAIRTSIILFIFVALFTALLAGAYLWTRPTIAIAAAEEKMKLISEVLPHSYYDNELLQDARTIAPNAALGLDEASTIYLAKKAGRPSAVVFEATAPDGYSGKIKLLIALDNEGKVIGVRVTQHKETPGLGDYIDPRKDKNKTHPWITQFNGLAPATISERDWKVKKDGGQFDATVGATVSPRAVVKAIRKASVYINENQAQLFGSKK